ncbi:hypothetical protein BD311DRAFT_751531 [Dichomitus squalens]|uniref:Uncharacterized protein n=1 Tax=Dichomitus squalens TaxID=114155 RepID=A0A4Q9N0P1_9APHY|nr:hypothetical protein BD311DRAFT_751531 [Dichomitus squalens]
MDCMIGSLIILAISGSRIARWSVSSSDSPSRCDSMACWHFQTCSWISFTCFFSVSMSAACSTASIAFM